MMLIDREDVVEIGLSHHIAFQVDWEIGSPEAVAADYADVLAGGPFLLVVNDEHAWAGQDVDNLYRVAERRLDQVNYRRWSDLLEIYVEGVGVSRQTFLLRLISIRRQLRARFRKDRGKWARWEAVHHWPDPGDMVWEAVHNRSHPEIDTREQNGQREVRYTG